MAGPNARKRTHQDFASKGKFQRPQKKQRKPVKKQKEYHSDSDEEDNSGFQPVNLLDSDVEDFDNAAVDDLDSASEASGSDSEGVDSDAAAEIIKQKKQLAQQGAKKQQSKNSNKATTTGRDSEDEEEEDAQPKRAKSEQKNGAKDAPDENDEDEDSESDEDDEDQDSDDSNPNNIKIPKKRNDPSAFATSMSKILSTKLSTTRRADPLLSRSADAHRAAQQLVDGALESKARRHMREQKRLASEKGRVRDVVTGGGVDDESAGGNAAREKRLRKTAHKGVVMLFRAVREAQERAVEAEGTSKKEGVVSRGQRGEKAAEMSRQGFLDLIAGGGGKLKKGGLEEA